MKILALVTDGFGASGGISRYNQALMRALSVSETVDEVTVLPRFGASVATPAKVSQLAPAEGKAAFAFRAIALVTRREFDVVFCGHLFAAPFAATLARVSGRPLWLQAHGIEAWTPRNGGVREAVESARLVTAVSRFTRARLLAWTDIDPARLRVLPNTLEQYEVSADDPERLREMHGLRGRRVILTLGRLSLAERYKGHDRIIAALPEIASRVPDVAWLVAGAGEDQARLERTAKEQGLANRVVFAGHVKESELGAYFQLARVFAMPSTGEGFGIVFLEAAAAGLAVVAGNRDGSVDALAEGVVGALIDPENRQELVEALVAGLEGRAAGDSSSVSRFAFPNFASHVDALVRTFL